MNDLFKELVKYPNTFKLFREWLFIEICKKDTNRFKSFGKQPNNIKIPYLIQFLETGKVPIIEALVYYNYKLNIIGNFETVAYSMIIWEFKRIEEKKETNYVPF